MNKLALLLVASLALVGTGSSAVAEENAENVVQKAANERPRTSAAALNAVEASALRTLGVVEGKPIDSGLVFIEGRYIQAPYTVSRRGRQISINGITVLQWAEWPLMDRHVREDPGPPPKEYEKFASFGEILPGNETLTEWLNCHVERKRRFLYEHLPKEEADKGMMAYYRQCPFVANARFVPEWGHVEITTKSGKKENMLLTAPPPHTVGHWDYGAKDVLRELEGRRDSLTETLARNGVQFFFGVPDQWNGTEIASGYYVPFWKHQGDLKLMVEVLASDRPEVEKIELLGRIDFLPSPNCAPREKKNYETLIRNFRPSAQLDARIAGMIKSSGVAPRTLKDLPDEIPWDRSERLYKEKQEGEQRQKEGQAKEQGAGEKRWLPDGVWTPPPCSWDRLPLPQHEAALKMGCITDTVARGIFGCCLGHEAAWARGGWQASFRGSSNAPSVLSVLNLWV